jgi:hypothetical protein
VQRSLRRRRWARGPGGDEACAREGSLRHAGNGRWGHHMRSCSHLVERAPRRSKHLCLPLHGGLLRKAVARQASHARKRDVRDACTRHVPKHGVVDTRLPEGACHAGMSCVSKPRTSLDLFQDAADRIAFPGHNQSCKVISSGGAGCFCQNNTLQHHLSASHPRLFLLTWKPRPLCHHVSIYCVSAPDYIIR